MLVLWLLALHQPAQAEPIELTLEAGGLAPLTAPQSERFGFGASGGVGLSLRIAPWLSLGARLRSGFLSDGPPPVEPELADPQIGTLQTLGALLRVYPFADARSEHAAQGWFLDAGGGGALTGDLLRGSLEFGVGYGLPVTSFTVAPVVRYLQVVQPSDPLSDEDARLLWLGLEASLLDRRPPPAPPPAAPPPSDQDGDGIPDDADHCADQAEDVDGYQDDDGCPDPDNDGDGIPDDADHCADQAEDVDDYEDDDGCPDPDNDGDGFLDADDQCPTEAEVINGNTDYDGCPDEGLIEMRRDRIVLEERVLFDTERARVKSRAKPVLQAIVELYKQHPEWIKLRIEGHADIRGSAEYNQELSQRRADHVREALIDLGIEPDVIEAVGYGSTRPRDLRTDSEEAHQRNRRVEFVVVARSTPQPAQGQGEAAAADEGSSGALQIRPSVPDLPALPQEGEPQPAAPAAPDEGSGAAGAAAGEEAAP